MAADTHKLLRDALTESARQAAIAERIVLKKAPDLDLAAREYSEVLGSIRDAQVLLAAAMDTIING